MPVLVRPARADDAAFLAEMLVEAVCWRPDGPRRSLDDVLRDPVLAHYVAGWPRGDDLGVVAQAEQPVGAAWLRYSSPAARGYGFVDAATPEVSVAVAPGWRGRGAGTRMLEALAVVARSAGARQLSLSVETDNPARRLYERMGFEHVGGNGGAVTMLLRL